MGSCAPLRTRLRTELGWSQDDDGRGSVDRLQLSDEIRALFEDRNFAHVATVMPDRSPHSVPVCRPA